MAPCTIHIHLSNLLFISSRVDFSIQLNSINFEKREWKIRFFILIEVRCLSFSTITSTSTRLLQPVLAYRRKEELSINLKHRNQKVPCLLRSLAGASLRGEHFVDDGSEILENLPQLPRPSKAERASSVQNFAKDMIAI